jgi:hypothetical protein
MAENVEEELVALESILCRPGEFIRLSATCLRIQLTEETSITIGKHNFLVRLIGITGIAIRSVSNSYLVGSGPFWSDPDLFWFINIPVVFQTIFPTKKCPEETL